MKKNQIAIQLSLFNILIDSLDSEASAEFISVISNLLQSTLLDKDFTAKFCNDRIIITFNSLDSDEDIVNTAQLIINKLKEKITFKGQELCIGSNIGLAILPKDNLDVFCENQFIKTYRSKNKKTVDFAYSSDELTTKIKNKLNIESDLRQAIDNNDTILAFQPQIDVNTGKIIGAEALVRWNHPTKGLMMPFDFLSLAEESNLIIKLGDKVLQEACKERVKLLKKGFDSFHFSINFSDRQLQTVLDAERIISIVEAENCPKEFINIEITEGMLVNHNHAFLDCLKLLKDSGFKLSLDNFGTGYFTLSHIKKLPLDYLKIDSSFIKGLFTDNVDKIIVKNIINLGQGLNFKVIAEGVESANQLVTLENYGCDIAQGYLFSKPLLTAEFESFILKTIELDLENIKQF